MLACCLADVTFLSDGTEHTTTYFAVSSRTCHSRARDCQDSLMKKGAVLIKISSTQTRWLMSATPALRRLPKRTASLRPAWAT